MAAEGCNGSICSRPALMPLNGCHSSDLNDFITPIAFFFFVLDAFVFNSTRPSDIQRHQTAAVAAVAAALLRLIYCDRHYGPQYDAVTK